jgi:hypothetical protein
MKNVFTLIMDIIDNTAIVDHFYCKDDKIVYEMSIDFECLIKIEI